MLEVKMGLHTAKESLITLAQSCSFRSSHHAEIYIDPKEKMTKHPPTPNKISHWQMKALNFFAAT